MTLKVELPPDVEEDLLAEAHRNGLTPEAFVERLLRERNAGSSGPTKTRSQIAGQRIRELRKGITLDGISVKELIEEGRE